MKKVVCMGDSITEGFSIEPEEAYPARLQELLDGDHLVVNKGACSSCVIDVEMDGQPMGYAYMRLEKYREALEEKGDIYILMFGTNDAQDGMDDTEDIRYPLFDMISRKADFVPCYQRMLDSVRKAAPEAEIYLGIPMPIGKCVWRKHQEKYLQELIPCYEELLRRNPGLRKIDVHGAFGALTAKEREGLYLEDGLHPNPKGAELIAETVYRALKTSARKGSS